MNKVYLLLRDNTESGPFTIDELIQQQLRSSDLIWVEGKSVAWSYPHELQEVQHLVPAPEKSAEATLNPSANELRTVAEPRTSISRPAEMAASFEADEIEAKAERIRLQTIHYAQHTHTPYFRSAEPSSGGSWATRENIQFIHHSKKKYVTLPQLIATGLITALLASAWYGDWSMIRVKPDMVTLASAPAAFNEERPIPHMFNNLAPLQPQAEPLNVDANGLDQPTQRSITQTAAATARKSSPATAAEPQLPGTEAIASATVTEESTDTRTNIAEHSAKKDAIQPAAEVKEPKKEDVEVEQQAEKKQVDKPAENLEEEKGEKKKRLGQVIKGIFKKKDKNE